MTLEADFARSVHDYWEKIFTTGDMISCSSEFTITVNPSLGEERRAILLEHTGGRAQAAVAPAIADRLAIQASPNLSSTALRLRLAEIGVALHDPDYVFYLPVEGKPELIGKHKAACRKLGEADRAAFEAFQASASAQDLDDAYVELDHWAVFGSFETECLASAGSMYAWDNAAIADIGVLTLPAFRGKGHASALVKTMSQFARLQGFEPQYRCQIDNHASVALANASGLVLFGTWEVSQSAPDREA